MDAQAYNSIPFSTHDRVRRLETLADWMDARWIIPNTNFKIGLDNIIGLIPGIGDTISAAVSLWIIKEAHHLGVPLWLKLIMLWNVLVDTVIGAIPVLGDLFDVGWKANRKNMKLIRQYMTKYQ